MKVSRKKLIKLLEAFDVDTTKAMTEKKVVLSNALANYARKTLIERTKLPEYKYTDEYGIRYILEVDEEMNKYYFTRIIDGRKSIVILQPDELEILGDGDITQAKLKELAYYVDHVAARFGL